MSATRDQQPSPPPTAPPAADRSNNFNLLRLGLATLVIFSHSPELVDGDRRREALVRLFGTYSFNEVALDGFFLLSGYLILQSWQHKPALGDFLKKRVLRIYPGFLVASTVSALVVGPLGADPARYFAELRVPPLILSMLALRKPAVPPVFAGQHYELVNGALWTIAYEFRCYLLVALLGVAGLAGRRWPWPALAAAALVGLVGLDLNALDAGVPSVVRLIIGNLQPMTRFIAFFGMGAAFYSYRDRIRYDGRLALAAAVPLAACMPRFATAQVALATLGGYMLFWFGFARIPFIDRYRKFPDVSYGVYLYGWPTQKLFLWYVPTLAPWALSSLTMAVCLIAGWLSWSLVERPCLKLKPADPRPAGRSGPSARPGRVPESA